MRLEAALEDFGLLLRRKYQGEEEKQKSTALAALGEYLTEYSGLVLVEEVDPALLTTFLLDEYPASESPSVEGALLLVDTLIEFATWLTHRGIRTLLPFSERARKLRDDLPRAYAALELLVEQCGRDDLRATCLLEGEEAQSPLGELGSGVDHLHHLDRLDYTAAEQDYFRVTKCNAQGLTLSNPGREALGEPALTVRNLPPGAADHLRVNDIIHAEVAPGSDGWEFLEVYGVRPGGYA